MKRVKVKKPTSKKSEDPKLVRAISVRVYEERLGAKDMARLKKEHGAEYASIIDGRAISYDSLTRTYLRVIAEHKSKGE